MSRLLALCLCILLTTPVLAEENPSYLRDRGPGIPTSMFGTSVEPGELIVYPFFEYYRDSDYEYKPSELGYAGETDFRGRYRATEELVFLCYGVSDRLALELEAAVIQASLEPNAKDTSGLPDKLEESGIGDVEGEIRWRWQRESARGPEIFSYVEAVTPTQDPGSLIGTTEWEWKLGSGISRGFPWGTGTFRAAVEYSQEESKVELGEFALEYLRRVSERALVYAGVEGVQDEWELITELQWRLGGPATLKLNNAFGITSKATDWAPEVGILFRFRP